MFRATNVAGGLLTSDALPDLAYAARGPPGGGLQSMPPTIVMVASMLAIFYSPAAPAAEAGTERERMLASMKRGDRVVTTSGMHGTVTGLNEHTVALRVADQVKLELTAPPSAARRGGAGREGCLGTSGCGSRSSSSSWPYRFWYLYSLKKRSTSDSTCRAGSTLMLGVEADKHVASQTDRTAGGPQEGARAQGYRRPADRAGGQLDDPGGAGQPAVVERRAHRGGRVLHLHAKR